VPFPVRLFKLVATHGDIDWVITNDLDSAVTAQVAQDANDVRWEVEELHRGLKQLTGSAKCQCRTGRSQRNHLACCYHAWLSLKVKAMELGKTLYQVRADLFRDQGFRLVGNDPPVRVIHLATTRFAGVFLFARADRAIFDHLVAVAGGTAVHTIPPPLLSLSSSIL
jgi:hypothetical protein